MMKVKYVVEIGYTDYIFDKGVDAVWFAETALYHLKSDGDKEIKITIEAKEVKENED